MIDIKTLVTENLTETRNRLLNEISGLSYEMLNKKPDTETWSIAQVCHHLYLSESIFTQAIIYGLNKSNGKKAEPKPIQLAVDRSQKAKAPDMVVPGDEPLYLEKITELLNQSRNLFFEFYNQLEDKSILKEKSTKHPLFGYTPLDQWVDLIYLHEERHIEQIREIKSLL
ncbi:putative damage-inducible protein DinB [Neobacillus niacini]|uniref:DinB family protein n=1 Tax=Neobacillus niacini TaxID=86668 RepID=UPI002784C357|nr:DinB family protein [Neobacillus niacini]MDQ1004483.1 putative damage-inducible protein DinB [Neobacillus niacini]